MMSNGKAVLWIGPSLSNLIELEQQIRIWIWIKPRRFAGPTKLTKSTAVVERADRTAYDALINDKKQREKWWRDKLGIGPAHALNLILTIFGIWGAPLDVFLKFEFWISRCRNFGAMGGQKSPLPIDKTHCLYNNLYLVGTVYVRNNVNKTVMTKKVRHNKDANFSILWTESCVNPVLAGHTIHLFRHFCHGMYRLATMHSVTDRQTDRREYHANSRSTTTG